MAIEFGRLRSFDTRPLSLESWGEIAKSYLADFTTTKKVSLSLGCCW